MDMQLSNPIISQSLSARSATVPGIESQNCKLPDGTADATISTNFAKLLAHALPPVKELIKPAAIKAPGAKDQNSENVADPVAGGATTINLLSPMSSAPPVIAGGDDPKAIRPNTHASQDANNPGMDVSGPILANFMPTQQPVGGAVFTNLSSPTSPALAASVSVGDQNTIRPNPRPAPETNNPGMDVSGPILANFMPTQQPASGAAFINLSSPTSSALAASVSVGDQNAIRPNPRPAPETNKPGMDVSGPALDNFMPTQQPASSAAFTNLSSPTSSALAATVSVGDQNTIRPNTRPTPEANKPGIDSSGPVLANFMPVPQAAGMKMKSESESIRLSASHAIAQQSAASAASTPDAAVQPSASEVQAAPARPAFNLQPGHDVTTEATATPQKQTIQATDLNAMPTDRIALTLPATAQNSKATPVQQLEIPIPIGNHDWNNQLGQRVIWMSSQQKQIAEIRINPPELGPIELRLTVDNQQSVQNATLHFVSPHAEVRSAIENSMPQLRVLMADAGITLGNATVSGESLPRQQTPGQEAAAGNNTFVMSSGKSGAIETTSPSPSLRRGNTLLDTFA